MSVLLGLGAPLQVCVLTVWQVLLQESLELDGARNTFAALPGVPETTAQQLS